MIEPTELEYFIVTCKKCGETGAELQLVNGDIESFGGAYHLAITCPKCEQREDVYGID